MKFYISDLHFGHKNIITYENRPFKDVEEMEFKMIQNWNNKVSATDEVYILGDLYLGNSVERVEYILKSLNGKKYLIRGNHDDYVDKANFDKSLFELIIDVKVVKDTAFGKEYDLVLFHYPIQTWLNQHRGWLHLYGHVHSNSGEFHPMQYEIPNSYNVSADVWNYTPVTLEEILADNH